MAIVAGLNADRSEGFVVIADREALVATGRPLRFDLADHRHRVRVRVDLFRQPRRGEVYCTDLNGLLNREPDRSVADSWHAVGGLLTLHLHSAQSEAGALSHAVVVSLENGVFRASDGRVVDAPREIAVRARLKECCG